MLAGGIENIPQPRRILPIPTPHEPQTQVRRGKVKPLNRTSLKSPSHSELGQQRDPSPLLNPGPHDRDPTGPKPLDLGTDDLLGSQEKGTTRHIGQKPLPNKITSSQPTTDQRMTRRRHQHQRHGLDIEKGQRLSRSGKPEITEHIPGVEQQRGRQPLRGHVGEQFVPTRTGPNLNDNIRPTQGKPIQHARHMSGCDGLQRTQPHGQVLASHLTTSLLGLIQQPASPTHHQLTSRREQHPSRGPLEQRHIERLLQRADLFGHTRRRHLEGDSGIGHRPVPHHRHERTQLT